MRDQYDDGDENGETGIEVSAGFFPLAWILLFCTPRVAIDGRVRKRAWGTYFFPVEPGRHRVEVWFAYLWMSECGKNSTRVEVEPGETTRVSFYMWPFMFMSGSMSASGPGPRSDSTRNSSGGTPMNKLWVIALAAGPLVVAAGIFFCCCGIGILGNLGK
jgi:hypothetical protein